MMKAFKMMVPSLMSMYKSPNKTLATLSLIAILNLCANNKELKYAVVAEGGIKLTVNYLGTRDGPLLMYNMQLIYR